MGQIVRRNKKGRPAKPDPAARDPALGNDLRRSLRRRNVKYVFDLDDYFDEDDVFADDEDQRRREKKLKHLLKLHNSESTASPQPCRTRRVDHALASSSSSSSDEDKPCKKRRIDEDMDEDIDQDNYNDDEVFTCLQTFRSGRRRCWG